MTSDHLVSPSAIEAGLNEALSTGADFAEIFVEESVSESLSVMDSSPQSVQSSQLYGAGLRVHFGHEEIYVTTNDLSKEGLVKAARMAAQAKKDAGPARIAKTLHLTPKETKRTYEILDNTEKFKFMLSLDQKARARSSLVSQTEPRLLTKRQRVLIANSEGLWVEDEREHHRVFMHVFVEHQGQKESFHRNEWSTVDGSFFQHLDQEKFAHATTDSALTLLKADYAPAGELPVIIDKGFGGVIFHEACGHGLETTSVAHGASVFCGKLGEKVASDVVTAIDDGTIAGGWGSLKYDDEGLETRKTTLIENGVLKSYMVDRLGAKKTGYAVTGSGRRQNYKFAPASRMRNTYIAAGTSSLDEMIRDIDYGIYAKDMGGGSVSPATGEFNFAIQEAYMIRGGRIAEAVKGASLIGKGADALTKVTKVGSELGLAAGMCGSVSGSIPAAVGQPALQISKMLVGGRVK